MMNNETAPADEEPIPCWGVMIDTETLGTLPGSAIWEVGAVAIDAEFRTLGEFERRITIDSCLAAGLRIDRETQDWWRDRGWIRQEGAQPLVAVLAEFAAWLASWNFETIWCKGATFDFPLLAVAYEAIGGKTPWQYWQAECMRTIWRRAMGTDRPKRDAAHSSLADCHAQIADLETALVKLHLKGGAA